MGYTPWLVTEEGEEPSNIDEKWKKQKGERKEERYLMALKFNDEWYLNDVANDVSYTIDQNIGYVVKIER